MSVELFGDPIPESSQCTAQQTEAVTAKQRGQVRDTAADYSQVQLDYPVPSLAFQAGETGQAPTPEYSN